MAAPTAIAESQNYLSRFVVLGWRSLAQLVRTPSHSRRAEAARRAARHALLLSAGLGAAIIALMFVLDAWEIGQMPKRGTPSLWWMRILTDFGKDEYVLAALGALLIAGCDHQHPRSGAFSARCCSVSARACSSCSAPCWCPH